MLVDKRKEEALKFFVKILTVYSWKAFFIGNFYIRII